MTPSGRTPVLLAAGGAAWEAVALRVVEEAGSRLVLLRRCMDLSDLLACAATGIASVAVVGSDVVGLDSDTVSALRGMGVSVVVVREGSADPDRIGRLGVDHQIDVAGVAGLPGVLLGAVRHEPAPHAEPAVTASSELAGEVIAVWGPTGAPGRTTVAVGIAAELAHRGLGTVLLDADPYGGAVAQHLGVLDQVSGLLAGARLANAGQLDPARLAGAARRVHDHLRVLSGLPRADRWVEVRAQAYDELLTGATTLEPYVVVDTGFCLERDSDPFAGTTGRNAMTTATLERADHVVVVGAADPVGLTRLVRGLHDLLELLPGVVPLVVVNKMRGSLGWTDRDVAGTISGVAPSAPVHFLPEDRPAVDRALMAGWSLVESGDSSLRRAVGDVTASLVGAVARR